jgi:hypothetical protein
MFCRHLAKLLGNLSNTLFPCFFDDNLPALGTRFAACLIAFFNRITLRASPLDPKQASVEFPHFLASVGKITKANLLLLQSARI